MDSTTSGTPGRADLGTSAKSAAAPPGGGEDGAALARLERFELQAISRQLLPHERIRYCLLRRLPHRQTVDVWYVPARRSAHYGGLMTCGSVWHCPPCAAKVGERRREELAVAVASVWADGGAVLLATYTVRHGAADTLRGTLAGFLAAQRAMTQNRPYRRLLDRYGIVGTIKGLEVTWGVANGWHPHGHTLMVAPVGLDLAQFGEELYADCWAPAARRQGLDLDRAHGVDLVAGRDAVADYVAKWGHQPTRRPWEAADELTKAHSKRGREGRYTPFDLLHWVADTGESRPVALFREYADEFKGRRQLVWSAGLRQLLGVDREKSDEEIAGEIREDGELLASLGWRVWSAIRGLGLRGHLLEAARSGDPLAVEEFCAAAVWRWEERSHGQGQAVAG